MSNYWQQSETEVVSLCILMGNESYIYTVGISIPVWHMLDTIACVFMLRKE